MVQVKPSMHAMLAIFFSLFLSRTFTPVVAPLGLFAVSGIMPTGCMLVTNGVYAVVDAAIGAPFVAMLIGNISQSPHDQQVLTWFLLAFTISEAVLLGAVQITVGAMKISHHKKSARMFRTPEMII